MHNFNGHYTHYTLLPRIVNNFFLQDLVLVCMRVTNNYRLGEDTADGRHNYYYVFYLAPLAPKNGQAVA